MKLLLPTVSLSLIITATFASTNIKLSKTTAKQAECINSSQTYCSNSTDIVQASTSSLHSEKKMLEFAKSNRLVLEVKSLGIDRSYQELTLALDNRGNTFVYSSPFDAQTLIPESYR
mgnify:CR=1 FL=1